MITALDSSVILDVLIDDPVFADKSARAIKSAAGKGQLIVSECVLSEIYPVLNSEAKIVQLLSDWDLVFVASSQKSALLAGQLFSLYLSRGGANKRTVPDFLIGAHAQIHADQLLARDRGYFRDYFEKLIVVVP
jgi:predicted nucleic acid-binding protein